jgi:hypothetical protein
MGTLQVAVTAQAVSEPPPTVDLGPILLLLAVAFIAYCIVIYIKEILIFLAIVAVTLMLLGVFQLEAILDRAFDETAPTPTPVPISNTACLPGSC